MAKSMFNQARKTSNVDFIDRTINRQNRKRGGEDSPDFFTNEDEARRIERNYIKKEYIKGIINKETAKRAMNSLVKDPQTGLKSDFSNLFSGVKEKGKEKFVKFLLDKYKKPKNDVIKESKVKLRSKKEVQGLRVNNRIYLVSYKYHIYARNFKTGRFAKFRKAYLKIFK